jgi:hypothetical protein
MTCVFGSRSVAASFGEKAAPNAQSRNAQNRSDALVLGLMQEVNLTRAVKMPARLVSFVIVLVLVLVLVIGWLPKSSTSTSTITMQPLSDDGDIERNTNRYYGHRPSEAEGRSHRLIASRPTQSSRVCN